MRISSISDNPRSHSRIRRMDCDGEMYGTPAIWQAGVGRPEGDWLTLTCQGNGRFFDIVFTPDEVAKLRAALEQNR